MIDAPTDQLKLVEYNTIASSLSSLSERVRTIQNYILDKYSDSFNLNYGPCFDDNLSSNNIETMADVFHCSCQRYLQTRSDKKHKDLWVLFVIDEGERNICD